MLPLVAVTTTLYPPLAVPGTVVVGVAGVLLPLPQPIPNATRHRSITASTINTERRRRRLGTPASTAANAKPPVLPSHTIIPEVRGDTSIAVWVAVVATVSVVVALPDDVKVTVLGFNEHVGGEFGVPEPEKVTLQARETLPLKPFPALMVSVLVPVPPAVIVSEEEPVPAVMARDTPVPASATF